MTPGIFVTGTDTEVSQTYVSALIARQLTQQGIHVDVYKPAASGCLENVMALYLVRMRYLWNAAGSKLLLRLSSNVPCPSCSPYFSSGRESGRNLLAHGIECWQKTRILSS